MSTRNYDSQVITQRLQDKVNAAYVNNIKTLMLQGTVTQIQQPMLSVPTQGFVNEVTSGSQTMYAKSEGVTVRDTPCDPTCVTIPLPSSAQPNVVDLNIGGTA